MIYENDQAYKDRSVDTDSDAYRRRIDREIRRAKSTGTVSRFLREDAQKREAINQAVDFVGKKHSVLNIPQIGTFDMQTGRNIAGMLAMGYEDNKKKGSTGNQTVSLPTADFDVCENGNPVTYTLYGSKKATA